MLSVVVNSAALKWSRIREVVECQSEPHAINFSSSITACSIIIGDGSQQIFCQIPVLKRDRVKTSSQELSAQGPILICWPSQLLDPSDLLDEVHQKPSIFS